MAACGFLAVVMKRPGVHVCSWFGGWRTVMTQLVGFNCFSKGLQKDSHAELPAGHGPEYLEGSGLCSARLRPPARPSDFRNSCIRSAVLHQGPCIGIEPSLTVGATTFGTAQHYTGRGFYFWQPPHTLTPHPEEKTSAAASLTSRVAHISYIYICIYIYIDRYSNY